MTEQGTANYTRADVEADIRTLSATELRAKYRQEANSHRNARARAGSAFDPSWDRFSDFLRDVGPAPGPHLSLDRIDHTNPAYGPGLVRWADKQTQAENRSNTIWTTYRGKRLSLADFVRETGVPYQTAYSAHGRGLSGDQIAPAARHDKASWTWQGPGGVDDFNRDYDRWARKVVDPRFKRYRQKPVFAYLLFFELLSKTQDYLCEVDLDYELPASDVRSLAFWEDRLARCRKHCDREMTYIRATSPTLAEQLSTEGKGAEAYKWVRSLRRRATERSAEL